MACDPNFGNVVLLLQLDGINGQLTTVDSSSFAWPCSMSTTIGSSLSTTGPLFGTACLYVPPFAPISHNPEPVQVPFAAGSALDIFAGPEWTIEGWVKPNVNASGNANQMAFLINHASLVAGVGGNSGFQIGLFAVGDGVNFQARAVDGGLFSFAGNDIVGPNTAIATGTWHHLAVVKANGQNATLYLDGVAQGTNAAWKQSSYTPAGSSLTSQIGSGSVGFTGPTLDCYVDEVRISNIAQYTTNFTPPTSAFLLSCNVTVPNVVGDDDATAQAAIVSAQLIVGSVTTTPDPSPSGTVLSQTPAGGTTALQGDSVNLVESDGPPQGTIPNIVNTSVAVVAPGILTAAGFVLGLISNQPSGVIIAGNIISQSPTAGTTATLGSAVNVVVSTGLPPLTVPDLFGLSQTEAISALTTLGLVVGAIGSAPSNLVPPNVVQTQNPSPGTAVAVGTVVSFVLSTGVPVQGVLFDFEATVISQYANSPTIMQLVQNLNEYIDQSTNFANFFNYVWNVDTAVGFGLDIWGKIVGVSRLLKIPNSTKYVGFHISSESQPAQDWTPAGDNRDTPPVGGAFYSGYNATETYLLGDDAYRQLILAKAFANICTTTAPAINQILQNLYGAGTAWVLNTGPMEISYNLTFTPSAIQLAILEQSGVIPTPPGVSVVINTNV